jgi:hypothetical protein
VADLVARISSRIALSDLPWARSAVISRIRPEGTAIEGYVVEDHADSVLGSFQTQAEAIEWAKKREHRPLVARVRHLNDKKNPDHWRAV